MALQLALFVVRCIQHAAAQTLDHFQLLFVQISTCFLLHCVLLYDLLRETAAAVSGLNLDNHSTK